MTKNWLILSSVAFGVSFSLSLPITRNVKDSVLAGLVAAPAAMAGALVVSRQQKQELGAIFSSLQTDIQALEQQKEIIKQSIAVSQAREKTFQESSSHLEIQIGQLQAQLDEREQQKQAIEQELNVLEQQKQALQTSAASLQSDMEMLEQQKYISNNTITDLNAQKQVVEAELEQLKVQRSQIHTELDAELQQKQILQHELQELEGNRQSLIEEIQLLKISLTELKARERELDELLVVAIAQRKQLDNQLDDKQQQKQAAQHELLTLEEQKQDLIQKSKSAENRLQNLRSQIKHLESVVSQKIEKAREVEVNLTQLNTNIQNYQRQKLSLRQELKQLLSQKEKNSAGVESRLQNLHNQEEQLKAIVLQKRDQCQEIETSLAQLRDQLQSCQQQKLSLTQELSYLSSQKEELTGFLSQLQEQILLRQSQDSKHPAIQLEEVPSELKPTQLENVEVGTESSEDIGTSQQTEDYLRKVADIKMVFQKPLLEKRALAEDFNQPNTATEFRLTNPEHTRWLWEGVIVPRWQCPPFLGSVSLPRYDTDEVWGTETILNVVGENLKRLGANYLEYDRIYDRLGDEDCLNWLNILTFTMSEYAYYMESEGGFWRGLCERLGLPYQDDNHEPISTLKNLALDGINSLKLLKAVGGYPIVSTLWLQSGIPYRNLNHFTDLVADLSREFGWSYLLNTDAELLAKNLLNTCQSRYSGRNVLRRFLEYSCQPQTEPVSGKLLQVIARVALALREYNLQPQEVLLNPSRRQEFLLSAVPQFNFFLRDWEAFIRVLTPPPSQSTRRRLSSEQVSLSLRLNIEDLLVELLLPGHTLSNPDWPSDICEIREAAWEGEIDASGQVTIDECVLPIYHIEEGWLWQLLDNQGNCLRSWYLEGVSPEFSCLIFDAWTGDRLLPTHQLTDSKDIFCFTPPETVIDIAGAVEFVEEGFIPCSIQGWRGQRLRLSGSAGMLNFRFADRLYPLSWTALATDPRLGGLRLRGQNSPYIEIPTLWYPPCSEPLSLTLGLQERFADKNPLIIQQPIVISASDRWTAISLESWIQQVGHYSVSLTATEEEWSQVFELQLPCHITAEEVEYLPTVQVVDNQGIPVMLPFTVTQTHQFWAITLRISGLWPLEPIKLRLSDGQSLTSRTLQADAMGHLKLELSTLYDSLPPSKQYFLDYERRGQLPQALAQLLEDVPLSWDWDGSHNLILSGLKPTHSYKLHLWNLLTPQYLPLEMPVEGETSALIPLELPPGIYYIQLEILHQSVENIGWWCGSDQYTLPVETGDDTDLENYCYTILDNALVGEFQLASRICPWDADRIATLTAVLEAGCYNFPDWLNADALLAKLRSTISLLQGEWYRISVTEGKRGDFRDALMDAIVQHNLWHLILDFRRHRERDERNIAFVHITDVEKARPYLSAVPHFEWMSRTPLNDQEIESLLEKGNVA